MKAIVAGATGLVGKELVKLLLLDSDFTEIIVYARRSFPIEDARLRVVKGELGELNQHSDELKGDVYFCCLGTTIKNAGSEENFRKVDYHGVVSFGRLAAHHKAKKLVVVSANSANAQSMIFYSKVKGEAEKTLKDLTLNALTIFRPGLLVGDREEKRTGERIGVQSFRVLRHILPVKVSKSVGTDVSALALRMRDEAKTENSGLRIIEAKDI